MERFRNFYETLGITRAATDMEVAQAYRAQLQKLQASAESDTSVTVPERLKLLEEAYRTLTNPAGRKKHDEEVAWQATKRELQAEEARRLAIKRKEEKEQAELLAKAALESQQAEAMTSALKSIAGSNREPDPSPRKHAAVDYADTVPQEDMEVAPVASKPRGIAALPLGTKAAVGCSFVVLLAFVAWWGLRRAPAPVPEVPVAIAPIPSAPASAALASASEPEPVAVEASAPAPTTVSKIPAGKAEEARLYQKVLQRVEQDHPELNPRHPQRRDDLIAYVAARVNAHVREGYPKAKALEIAVRDLETQEQTRRVIESFKAEKPKPVVEAAPAVLDAGGHVGFDPKCRWVTSEQWSCK